MYCVYVGCIISGSSLMNQYLRNIMHNRVLDWIVEYYCVFFYGAKDSGRRHIVSLSISWSPYCYVVIDEAAPRGCSFQDRHDRVWYGRCENRYLFYELIQDIHNSLANALELRRSCTNPSIFICMCMVRRIDELIIFLVYTITITTTHGINGDFGTN